MACRAHRIGIAEDKIMLDAIYIGLAFGFFMAFCIYAVGCEKL
jgi:hypothetical protein